MSKTKSIPGIRISRKLYEYRKEAKKKIEEATGLQISEREIDDLIVSVLKEIEITDYYVRIKGEDVNNKLLQQQGLIKKEEKYSKEED